MTVRGIQYGVEEKSVLVCVKVRADVRGLGPVLEARRNGVGGNFVVGVLDGLLRVGHGGGGSRDDTEGAVKLEEGRAWEFSSRETNIPECGHGRVIQSDHGDFLTFAPEFVLIRFGECARASISPEMRGRLPYPV